MSSIQTPKKLPLWKSKNWKIESDIEKKFRRVFDKSGYKVIYIHGANQEQLQEHLSSNKTLALFWVSHAASKINQNSSIKPMATILDIDGNNVLNLFSKTNPNIKFLSILGCNALESLKELKDKNKIHNNTKIHSFSNTISLSKAIRSSIRQASKILDQSPKTFRKRIHLHKRRKTFYREHIIGKQKLYSLSEESLFQKTYSDQLKFEILNSNPQFSAQIKINGEYIGLLKKSNSYQKFYLPLNILKKGKNKLILTYENKIIKTESNLVPVDLSFYNYTFLKSPNGNIWGSRSNVYYFEGYSQL